MSTPGSSEPIEAVDWLDTNDPAISHDQEMTSSPTTNDTDGPKLTMADSNISEIMPGDEEGPPPPSLPAPFPNPPEEQSLKPAPEEPLSSPTSIGSDKMVVMEANGTDDVETSNNINNNNNNNNNDKDGLVKPTKQEKKKIPEMNPRYKDVQETGQWGDLSSREFYIAIVGFLLIIIVVVLVVLFVVILPGNDDASVSAPTNAPTIPPSKISPNEELALVLTAIEKSPFTAPLLEDTQLPNDPTFYEGLMDDDSSTSQQKAINWLLSQDEFNDPEQSVFRFALASMYYELGGPNWASSEGWLTSVHLCEWENISCDTRNVFQELDLSDQGLTGTLPTDIALLGETSIRSILMSRNNISGPIPGGVLASLPNLGILYLDNNALTGTIPVELVVDARLQTLYLQSNQLTGDWPTEFCQEGRTLLDFGLDCDKLLCSPDCCTPLECYYSS